jgi:hypothetical protein
LHPRRAVDGARRGSPEEDRDGCDDAHEHPADRIAGHEHGPDRSGPSEGRLRPDRHEKDAERDAAGIGQRGDVSRSTRPGAEPGEERRDENERQCADSGRRRMPSNCERDTRPEPGEKPDERERPARFRHLEGAPEHRPVADGQYHRECCPEERESRFRKTLQRFPPDEVAESAGTSKRTWSMRVNSRERGSQLVDRSGA